MMCVNSDDSKCVPPLAASGVSPLNLTTSQATNISDAAIISTGRPGSLDSGLVADEDDESRAVSSTGQAATALTEQLTAAARLHELLYPNMCGDLTQLHHDTTAQSANTDDDSISHCGSGGASRKRKKMRTTFTGRQIFELERVFESKKYLASSDRTELARLLDVSEQQVKIWFQNRRTKWKKLENVTNETVNELMRKKNKISIHGLAGGPEREIGQLDNFVHPSHGQKLMAVAAAAAAASSASNDLTTADQAPSNQNPLDILAHAAVNLASISHNQPPASAKPDLLSNLLLAGNIKDDLNNNDNNNVSVMRSLLLSLICRQAAIQGSAAEEQHLDGQQRDLLARQPTEDPTTTDNQWLSQLLNMMVSAKRL